MAGQWHRASMASLYLASGHDRIQITLDILGANCLADRREKRKRKKGGKIKGRQRYFDCIVLVQAYSLVACKLTEKREEKNKLTVKYLDRLGDRSRGKTYFL